MTTLDIQEAKRQQEMFRQGLISQEEYDILRGYERYRIEDDPQWQEFFKHLPKVIENFLDNENRV